MPDISGVVEHFPYLALFSLLILGGIGFPFPEDTTLILCGFLISTGVVELLPSFLVVYAGLLAADLMLYLVGKKYGRMIVAHRRFRSILTAERLSRMEEKFRRWGMLVIMIGRHLVGLRAQIFLAAGVMRMPAIRFLAADAVSSVFTIALMVGAGYMGGHSLQVIRKDVTRVGHLGILLSVLLLSGYLLLRYVRVRRHKPVP